MHASAIVAAFKLALVDNGILEHAALTEPLETLPAEGAARIREILAAEGNQGIELPEATRP